MVSLVLVAHSAELAEAAKTLAEQVCGGRIAITAAGGVDDPDHSLGTDATRVAEAIRAVHDPRGVLVLVDLGSALLSAETALELLPVDLRHNVRISPAALVEGAVAAASAAAAGGSLEAVEAEARRALAPKEQHLGVAPASAAPDSAGQPDSTALSEQVVLPNPLGIHARPAGLIVATAARYDARLTLVNQQRDRLTADARSLTQVIMLDARQGDSITIRATGPQAPEAVQAVADLLRAGFGESSVPEPSTPGLSPAAVPGQLSGLPASPGIGLGPALSLSRLAPALRARREGASAEDEIARLEEGLRRARQDTLALAARTLGSAHPEAGIFQAQIQLLDDPELVASARARLAQGQESAEEAWRAVTDSVSQRLGGLSSPLLAARAADVRDVGRRVLLALAGEASRFAPLSQPSILITRDALPSDVACLDPTTTLGLAAAFGAPNSHACILAHALGIPMAVGLGLDVLCVPDGQVVGLDGTRGVLYLEMTQAQQTELRERAAAEHAARAAAQVACHAPAITLDGRAIEVAANLGRVQELEHALRLGAEGIGVLRTEFLFLNRDSPPSEAEQEEVYRTALSAMAGQRVIIRTLDIGGDKPVAYLPAAPEANPYLGERGLRKSLKNPGLFLAQARALYRASDAGRLHILLPMVTTVDEIRRARRLLDQARREAHPHPPLPAPPLGIMIETPASALGIDHLLREVDFVSLGTNDLTQYTLAAERGNPAMAPLYDACHPTVLRLIATVVDAAHRVGKWAGVCGEVAADPQAIPILIGLGVDELSMAPGAIPMAKQQIRGLHSAEAKRIAHTALTLESAPDVRALTG